jgi:hypothetical protein
MVMTAVLQTVCGVGEAANREIAAVSAVRA